MAYDAEELALLDDAKTVYDDARRVAVRKPFQAEIEVSQQSDHNFYTSFTENISSGGLFIATRDLLDLGTIIEIGFTLPNREQKITTRAEVRWQRLEELNQVSSVPGIGVKFLDLSTDEAEAINTFINQRDTLFFDDE